MNARLSDNVNLTCCKRVMSHGKLSGKQAFDAGVDVTHVLAVHNRLVHSIVQMTGLNMDHRLHWQLHPNHWITRSAGFWAEMRSAMNGVAYALQVVSVLYHTAVTVLGMATLYTVMKRFGHITVMSEGTKLRQAVTDWPAELSCAVRVMGLSFGRQV